MKRILLMLLLAGVLVATQFSCGGPCCGGGGVQVVVPADKCFNPAEPDTTNTKKNQIGFQFVVDGTSLDVVFKETKIASNWNDTPLGCTYAQQEKAWKAAQTALRISESFDWDLEKERDFKAYGYSAYDWRGIRWYIGEKENSLNSTNLNDIMLQVDNWTKPVIIPKTNGLVTMVQGFDRQTGSGIRFQFYLIKTQKPGKLVVPDYTPASPQLFDWALILQVSGCKGAVESLTFWPIFKQTPIPGAPGLTPCPPGVDCSKGRMATPFMKFEHGLYKPAGL